MDLKVGDDVELMGKSFKVNACYKERGNKDDITAWIWLADAQELLDKQGKINAILALECHCTGEALPLIRKEIAGVLPDTQVIERGSRAIARAEARTKVAERAALAVEEEKEARATLRRSRERFASVLIPVVVTACAVWVAVLGFTNVRTRRDEIGILRTLGVSAKHVLVMFMSRHVLLGVLGGALGFALGVMAGSYFSTAGEGVEVQVSGADFSLVGLLLASIGGAAALAVIAGWIPALMATRQDPAVVLRQE
jgi:putative ABC transport system permease protein